MKRSYLFGIILLGAMPGITDCMAQTMVIKNSSGQEQICALSSLNAFSFSNNNLVVSYLNHSSESINLTNVKALYFYRWPLSVSSIKNSESALVLYPNPVQDIAYLKNVPTGNYPVLIYRMDGALVLKKIMTEGDESIDVSTLGNGLYVLKANNQTIKFRKQ